MANSLVPAPTASPGLHAVKLAFLSFSEHLLWWQFLAILGLGAAAFVSGWIASRISGAILRRLAHRASATWDDAIAGLLGGPLGLATALAILYAGTYALSLPPGAESLLARLARTGGFILFFWILARMVDVGRELALHAPWAQEHAAARALLPVGTRVLKVLVGVVAVLAVLGDFGFPVTSLVAGLGIGGLAFALASQKTVEHLFGAVAIGLDQPFRVGDFVKIEEFVGTVETIGIRSTRIRTLDRTIITIPNGKLAEMRTETYAVRDRIRFSATIGLVYETSATQLREILEGWEQVLRNHPQVWHDGVTVCFSKFGESSLDVEVAAWFVCDGDAFVGIRQETLLLFMEIVERAGSSFAFPSRTLYHVGSPAALSGVRAPGSRAL